MNSQRQGSPGSSSALSDNGAAVPPPRLPPDRGVPTAALEQAMPFGFGGSHRGCPHPRLLPARSPSAGSPGSRTGPGQKPTAASSLPSLSPQPKPCAAFRIRYRTDPQGRAGGLKECEYSDIPVRLCTAGRCCRPGALGQPGGLGTACCCKGGNPRSPLPPRCLWSHGGAVRELFLGSTPRLWPACDG